MNDGDSMADSAWEIYECYGPGAVAYCESQRDDARARGDAGMEAYWGSMARLAAGISDPEAPVQELSRVGLDDI